MSDSTKPAGRPTGLWIATVILLVINSLQSFVFADGPGVAKRLGAGLVPTVVLLVVIAVAKAASKGGSGRGPARAGLGAMIVLLVLNLKKLGEAASGEGVINALAVTPAERADLQVDSDSIRHPGFRFTFPHPGASFVRAPELERRFDSALAKEADVVAWVFSNSDNAGVVVQVTKLDRLDAVRFQDFSRGLERGLKKSDPLATTTKQSGWNGRQGEYQVAMQREGGPVLRTRCVGRVESPPLIVCVQTNEADGNGLAAVRDGLVLQP